MTRIIREIHLVDDLKTNMLIENDLIDFEEITIDVTSKSIYIDSCDVIISMKVKISRIVVRTSMHARKTMIVSSRSKMIVSIHHNAISQNRNFLFELDELNLSLYAYLVNVEFRTILMRNDSNKVMQLSRNHRIERITKLDFSNAFQIFVEQDACILDLALRKTFVDRKTR